MIELRYCLAFCCLMSFGFKLSSAVYFSQNDINEIYTKYVKPNMNAEYMNRYIPFPLNKNTGPWKWENKDLGRVIAVLEFERFVLENKLSCKKGLAVNEIDPAWHYLPHKDLIEVSYDEKSQKNDLHLLDLEEKDFDFVMVNQTLEHLYDPIRCLENIYRHMVPGGLLYLNVPTINIFHSTPFHYYTGFTPVGLGALVKAAGFKILHIGYWGNLDYIIKLFQSNFWPDYSSLKNPGFNDVRWPVIAWVFAIK